MNMAVRQTKSVLPQGPLDLEIEQALLGAILNDSRALGLVSGFLRAEHFAEPIHARIYELCERMVSEGGRPSILTLRGLFAADQRVGDQTVQQYLAQLHADAGEMMSVRSYGEVLLDLANRRRLLDIAHDIAAGVTDRATPASSVATEAIQVFDTIVQSQAMGSTPRVSIGIAAKKALEASRNAKAGSGLRGATTGIPDLDRQMVGGMLRGRQVAVGARTAVGKTALALVLALKAARAGHGVYYVSLEMVDEELGIRALASIASRFGSPILYEDIIAGRTTPSEDARLETARAELDQLPLLIEQEPGLSVAQIAARARTVRQIFRRRGMDLTVVITDHLGLVRPPEKRQGNKVAETADVSSALKRMAKEIDVCSIALCQISRSVEGRDDKRPTLADFKWSGAIEEDADVVLGLFREGQVLARITNPTTEQLARLTEVQFTMEAIFLKNRQGREGTVELYCNIGANVIEAQRKGLS